MAHQVAKTFTDAMDDIMDQMRSIMLEKRKLRGTDNIKEQGISGLVDRMALDKFSRIKRQVKDASLVLELEKRGMPHAVMSPYLNTGQISNETLEDDFMDIANYCIIAIALLRGQWGLE